MQDLLSELEPGSSSQAVTDRHTQMHFRDDNDREALEAMNELDREMELMERADRRDAAIQRAKALRQQEQQEKAKAKEVCRGGWLQCGVGFQCCIICWS